VSVLLFAYRVPRPKGCPDLPPFARDPAEMSAFEAIAAKGPPGSYEAGDYVTKLPDGNPAEPKAVKKSLGKRVKKVFASLFK
jgi:hypothetical protein